MNSSVHVDNKGKDISKDWSVDNMKDTGLNGYVYDFSIDYDATSVDDIKDFISIC